METGEVFYAKDFVEILQELRAGKCALDVTNKLNRLVEGCVKTGKKGTLTLKLTVTPKGAQVIVKDDIKAPVPEYEVQPTLMFVDGGNNLVRHNPMQRSLPGTVKIEETGETVQLGENGEVITVN